MTILALDIGGTKLAAAEVSTGGDILEPVLSTPTPAVHGPSAVLETAVGLLRNLDRSDVRAVGVASAGVVDPDRGTVVG
ncbi:MAG: glucokinase, partial [Nocardioidaceae bacterium]|nr:glucokinase [Nocardioidaceae bacterium]